MASSVPQKDDVDRWSVEQVAAWLRQMELTDCCEVFLRKGIDGHSLLHLTEESLVLWGRDLSIRNCKQIMKLISQIQNQHVFGSGRQQINNIIGSRSQIPSRIQATRQSHQAEEDDEDDGTDSDDGWATDEFDDREQDSTINNHPQDGGNIPVSDNNEDAELYMIPSPAPGASNFPNHVPKNFTNKPSSPGPPSQQRGYPSPKVSAFINRIEQNPSYSSKDQGPGPRGPAPIEPPRRTPPVPPGVKMPVATKPESNRRGPLPIPGFPQGPGGQVPRSGSPKTVGGPQDYNSRGPVPLPNRAPSLPRRGPLPIPGYSQGSEALKDSARPGQVPRAGSPKTVVDYSSRGPVPIPGLPLSSDSLRRAVHPPVNGHPISVQSEQSDSLRRGPAPTPNSPSVQEQGPLDIKRRAPMPLPASPIPGPGSPKTFGSSLDSTRRGSIPPQGQAPTSDPPRRVPPPISAPQNSNQADQIDVPQRGPPPVPPTQEHGSLDIKKRGPMPLPGSPTGLQKGPALLSKTNTSGPETQNTPPIRPPSRPPPRINHGGEPTKSPPNSRSASPIPGNVRSIFPGNSNEGGHPPVRNISNVNKTINLFNSVLQPPSNASEESGHVYEVVEDPSGSFSNQENFSAPQQSGPTPTNPPALPPRNQDAREPSSSSGGGGGVGRVGVSPHPLLQPPAPRPQTPAAPPIQLPTLAPPPVPKQFPGQPRLPAPPPPVPANSPPFLDLPPPEMAPGVPGAVPGAPKPKPVAQVDRAERVPLDDGGTIELTPLYRSLYERPYFHIISRIKSKEILETADDGVFLIRPSKRSSEPLTLCLRYKNRTYNINIRCRPDGLFALGYQKTNEMTFRTIDDLVSTYTREPIKLQNGDRTLLTVPPQKFDHIYVKMPTNFNSNRK